MSSSPVEPTKIIHSWAIPRCLSTATMYAFSSRPECKVYDEPLYANYLRCNQKIHRPYREELVADTRSASEVLQAIHSASSQHTLTYVKHVVKQLDVP